MGLEPTISCLEGKRSTTELRPRGLYSTVTGTGGQPVQRQEKDLTPNPSPISLLFRCHRSGL